MATTTMMTTRWKTASQEDPSFQGSDSNLDLLDEQKKSDATFPEKINVTTKNVFRYTPSILK
jgi:hypothetical protein